MVAERRCPPATERLRFREMVADDLDEMAAMLGDPEVMAYYPAPKSRDETATWIANAQRSYADHGMGLWLVETHDGDFIGDCGLTWQSVNGRRVLEVGYHVRAGAQRRGYATEAVHACVEEARRRFPGEALTAIVHPENTASLRVAEKSGMTHTEDDHDHPWIVRTVMSMPLHAPARLRQSTSGAGPDPTDRPPPPPA